MRGRSMPLVPRIGGGCKNTNPPSSREGNWPRELEKAGTLAASGRAGVSLTRRQVCKD